VRRSYGSPSVRSSASRERVPGERGRIDRETLAAIREGLRTSTSELGGTSTEVFDDWPHDRLPVYGKTDTAERPPHPDQSWYAAFVEHRSRPLVVVTTIEGGGFGEESAAPAARLILSSWFDVPARFVRGNSRTR
jgi:penicillin-binding protein 2